MEAVLLLDELPVSLSARSSLATPQPSLLAELLAASSAIERRRLVHAALQAIGFDSLGYGSLVQEGERARPLWFCTGHADSGWVRHYFAHAYHEVDPRLHAALRSSLPCWWTVEQLAQRAAGEPSASPLRRFVADLRDTGVRCGALLALPGVPGATRTERRVVSLLSRTPLQEATPDPLLGAVLTLALSVHEFYLRCGQPPMPAAAGAPAAVLNPLQRDILARVARGSSDKQIAHELQMSSHAVDYHMRQLRRRFSVRNRLQLTQAALRDVG